MGISTCPGVAASRQLSRRRVVAQAACTSWLPEVVRVLSVRWHILQVPMAPQSCRDEIQGPGGCSTIVFVPPTPKLPPKPNTTCKVRRPGAKDGSPQHCRAGHLRGAPSRLVAQRQVRRSSRAAGRGRRPEMRGPQLPGNRVLFTSVFKTGGGPMAVTIVGQSAPAVIRPSRAQRAPPPPH